jgi:PST family polysaccharide transporter
VSDLPAIEPASAKPASVAPLGQRVASGFAWTLASTISSKFLTMAAQMILTWLLRPEDFGLIGLAYTVTTFCIAIQGGTVPTVVIQRQAFFKRWANPAFWIAFTLGLVAVAAMLIAAPFAARMYHRPELVGIIAVSAANTSIQVFSFIPLTKLKIALRFRTLSILALAELVITSALSILLAGPLFRAGAYSFVIPTLVVGILRIPITMALTHTGLPRLRLQLHRWVPLLKDMGLLFLSTLLSLAVLQGDYVVLGLFTTTATVGTYFLAFSLSMQVISFLTGNLSQVLFPTLSKLQQDPVRQVNAFTRACRVLGMVTIPLCLTQAALIDPAIRCLLSAKWLDTILIAEILSVGMALRSVTWTAPNLLLAQGRNRRQLVILACSTVAYLAAIVVGTAAAGSVGTAVSEALFFTLAEPVFFYIVVRSSSVGFSQVLSLLAKPALCGLLVGGLALAARLGAQALFPAFSALHPRQGSLIQLLAGSVVALAAYLLLVPRIMPEDWKDLLARIPLLAKISKSQPASDDPV